MNRVNHPDVFDVDLPRIEVEIGDSARFEELLTCFDKAVLEIRNDPANEGAPLTRPPLATYRKKKFHSMRRPPQGFHSDMRLVYRCDLATNTLYVLGVGRRHPYHQDDIYSLLASRSPI